MCVMDTVNGVDGALLHDNKHALHALKVGVKTRQVFFDSHLKKWGSIDPHFFKSRHLDVKLQFAYNQNDIATDHCTLVMRSQDHSKCSSHVVQGELLPKTDP